jgi:hypothetical protein
MQCHPDDTGQLPEVPPRRQRGPVFPAREPAVLHGIPFPAAFAAIGYRLVPDSAWNALDACPPSSEKAPRPRPMEAAGGHAGGVRPRQEGVMAPAIPDFDTAVEKLRGFMAGLGHPPIDLAWVFREDVSTRKRRVLVKVPLPADNRRIARSRYNAGRLRGIGVCLDVFCRLGPAYCCSCWFVQDREESARRLCSGLKLSVASDLPEAHPVRSRLAWRGRRWLDARSGFHHLRDFLPPRDAGLDRDEDQG